METRQLGKTGLEVTVLGLGTSEIGFQLEEGADVGPLLNEALDAGLNLIDTAECYRDAESKIGSAVGHRRDDFFLFSKTGHASGLEGDDWDPAMMARGIERSLANLRTDHLDLLQLHSCSLDLLQRGEVVQVVQRAKEAGKTRFIGYSGDGPEAQWAIQSGLFDTLQTSISVCDQANIDLMPQAIERGMGVIVKRPVANGVWRSSEPPASPYAWPYYERYRTLAYPWSDDPAVAGRTALRFTLSVPGVSTMIVGTRTPGRWLQNAAVVAEGALSDAEYRAIRDRWAEVAQPDWVGLT
jgi:aryl-alcohol dehydrogenase-like predicted oxidoreductase